MLSTISIPVKELFDVGQNNLTGEMTVTGRAYAFDWETFLKVCVHDGETVDGYLSRFLLRGFLSHRTQNKVLILYQRTAEQFCLTACNAQQKVPCHWLADLPGYIPPALAGMTPETDLNALHEDALPLMYWDSESVYRVYPFPQDNVVGDYLMCDWGHDSGQLFIGNVTEDIYKAVYEHPKHYTCFSPIPQQTERIFMIDQQKQVLKSAFYQISH